MKSKKSYVLPIAIMFALFFMIAFVSGLQNPMGVIVKNQFEASNFLSQLGNFANFLAYAFMGIPAGLMLQKYGYKKTALSAIIVGLVGVSIIFLSGQVANFAVYLFGAFVSGFSMCMLNVVVNPLLNSLGSNQKRGNQLLQFGGSFNSLGATIVPVLIGYFMGSLEAGRTIDKANPALLVAMGIFVIAFFVLFFAQIPEPFIEKKEKEQKGKGIGALSFRHFVFGMIAIFIYVGVEVGIPNIANLYMTSAAADGGLFIDPTIAGTVIGTYWFLMLVGRLTGGIIGAKYSSRTMLTVVSSGAIMFILAAILIPSDIVVNMPVFRSDISFGFAEVPMSIMFLILCGLCTSVMWGNIFNLATAGLGKFTASASGLFMVMVVGGGILPALQGGFADIAGFVNSYWIVFVGLSFIFYFAVSGHKNVNPEKSSI